MRNVPQTMLFEAQRPHLCMLMKAQRAGSRSAVYLQSMWKSSDPATVLSSGEW